MVGRRLQHIKFKLACVCKKDKMTFSGAKRKITDLPRQTIFFFIFLGTQQPRSKVAQNSADKLNDGRLAAHNNHEHEAK